MFDFLESIVNIIISIFRAFANFFETFFQSLKVLFKLSLFSDQYFYLIPGFLGLFAAGYFVIFIINRILNGRN